MRRLLLGLLFVPSTGLATVHYTLQPDPLAGSLRVTVRVEKPKGTERFRIPAWTPGFYFLHKYQDKIFDVTATNAKGQPLRVSRYDDRGWAVANPERSIVTLSYRVRGDDAGLGFFGATVREDSTFVNGPAVFMYSEGRLEEKTRLVLGLPYGWDVATAMDRTADGAYVAGGYDELADHPLQLGRFHRRQFKVMGHPFEAVYVTRGESIRANVDAETERLRRVSEPAIRMFGGVPFKKYLYIVHLAPGSFFGGLEHRSSTVIALPNVPQLHMDDLAAHEFFHTWNVKHIRPKVLGPFDYTREVRTANLWFAEGVTDYYAKLHTYQSGLQSEEWLLQSLAQEIATLQNSRSRLRITLEDTSRRAWENGGFGVADLSYYNKGLVVGLLLDAQMRADTEGRKSLDDVMRLLFKRHRLPLPGYEEDAILKTINEVTGKDFEDYYRSWIQSTEELNYATLAGLGLRLLHPGEAYMRPKYRLEGDRVVALTPEAEAAGLRKGDIVLGVPGSAKAATGADALLDTQVRRGNQNMILKIPYTSETTRGYRLIRNPHASTESRQRLEEWLRRPTGS